MLAISCNQCHRTHYAECEMAPQAMRCGKPDCPHTDPDAAFDLGAGSACSCCPQDHHHGKAANNCAGGHGGCAVVDCAVLTPVGEPCPGGHCGLGIDGCTVCRPLTITVVPGSKTATSPVNMQLATG
jgi:hypothetical protein